MVAKYFLSKKLKLLLIGFCSLIIFCTVITTSVFASIKHQQTGIKVPIIMYHSVVKSEKRLGKYVVSPDTLKNDIKYLKENGFTAIFISDLVNYVYKNKPLPEKPVVLTFDDGHLNYITDVTPILKEYKFKAVASVVGEYTDKAVNENEHNPLYSNLTWDEISELQSTDLWEVANHTYYMHNNGKRNGCKKIIYESTKDYQKILYEDLNKLQNNLAEKSKINPPIVFTYPFGAISKESFSVLKNLGFKASLSCCEKINCITTDPECLFLLGRYNRPSGISTEDFMRKITK